jgi:hypothetical protein
MKSPCRSTRSSASTLLASACASISGRSPLPTISRGTLSLCTKSGVAKCAPCLQCERLPSPAMRKAALACNAKGRPRLQCDRLPSPAMRKAALACNAKGRPRLQCDRLPSPAMRKAALACNATGCLRLQCERLPSPAMRKAALACNAKGRPRLQCDSLPSLAMRKAALACYPKGRPQRPPSPAMRNAAVASNPKTRSPRPHRRGSSQRPLPLTTPAISRPLVVRLRRTALPRACWPPSSGHICCTTRMHRPSAPHSATSFPTCPPQHPTPGNTAATARRSCRRPRRKIRPGVQPAPSTASKTGTVGMASTPGHRRGMARRRSAQQARRPALAAIFVRTPPRLR